MGAQDRFLAMLTNAFQDPSTGGLALADRQNQGDGVVMVLPSHVDSAAAVAAIIDSLARQTRQAPGASDQVRLRMSVTEGIIGMAANGFVGSSVVEAARLIDADALRSAFALDPSVRLGVIVSDSFFVDIASNAPRLRSSDFNPVEVAVKNYQARAWIRLI